MSLQIDKIPLPQITLPAPEKVIPESYNLADMAAINKVSEKTVKKLIDKGLLPQPAVRDGKIWIWPRALYDAWVAKKLRRV